eukprot:TRINITY_DN1976_c4_g1_i1.p1 TRINITY_DN1976_c4_g1~~TRINITY_DN1976_c4_g1_i1.p1  ORF type:complete len:1181 (+),score=367.16 TRINITY_DN1976_c4_g1_i1:95-3544(+)
MPPPELLSNSTVRRVALLQKRAWWRWLVVWPFAVVYLFLCFAALCPEVLWADVLLLGEYFHAAPKYFEWGARLSLPVLVFAHAITTLLTIWSPRVNAKVFYGGCGTASADHVLVEAREHKGDDAVVPVHRTAGGDVCFWYQKRRYTWDPAASKFARPALPLHKTVREYCEMRGHPHVDAEQVSMHGKNHFDIQIPTFRELMIAHVLAPFFVFQMFCVLLWMLDEYWHYSLFTGVMLFVFEATMVKQQLRNMQLLLTMEQQVSTVAVLRGREWKTEWSCDLLPGDIVQIERSAGGDVVPCDMLLLEGTAVTNESLLTGESTPQVKESIAHRSPDDVISPDIDKVNIVFGGTEVLMSDREKSDREPRFPTKQGSEAVGLVLRTGYETSQGKLVRTIIHSARRDTAGSGEAFAFIGCLLLFALVAAGYVLYTGLQDPGRSRWKLLLSCSLILTSVVPPELPMELSLAVNTCQLALHKLDVYCTEPFRIPHAGGLDTCCFDKTGTLTVDVMQLVGIRVGTEGQARGDAPPPLTAPAPNHDETLPAHVVFAGCNSLVHIGAGLVGDSMEQCALRAVGWAWRGENTFALGRRRVRRIARHPFQAALKRMSAVVEVSAAGSQTGLHVVCKGAPEAIRGILSKVPADYDSTYRAYARAGGRIIALAHKKLPQKPLWALRDMPRAQAESDLTFAGFGVFRCPLRYDARSTTAALREASQNVVMITGDNELTAAWVAQELGIAPLPCRFLRRLPDGSFAWADDHDGGSDGSSAAAAALQTAALCKSHSLVVTGGAMAAALEEDPRWLHRCAGRVIVWARCSPREKEHIVLTLNALGHKTLMCGDGTNDVGALRQAHVGVGLLGTAARPRAERRDMSNAQQAPTLAELMDRLEDDCAQQAPVVRLGDASIASPFTSRNASTTATCHILRLGRCTLVTTLQMYKILAVNCLVSAYCLSVLTNQGVKFGDFQLTVNGVVIAVCFLCIAFSKPLDSLSRQRPHTRVFCPYILLSIATQFAAHLYFLIESVSLVSEVVEVKPPSNFDDANFEPTLLNTVVFLMSMLQGVLAFAFNYQGRPYMTGLWENRPLIGTLAAMLLLTAVCTAEVFPDFNEYIELHSLPADTDFKERLFTLMFQNAVAAGVAEGVCLTVFRSPSGPRKVV